MNNERSLFFSLSLSPSSHANTLSPPFSLFLNLSQKVFPCAFSISCQYLALAFTSICENWIYSLFFSTFMSVCLPDCMSVCLPLCERRSVLLFNVSLFVSYSVLVTPSVCLSFCLSLPATSVRIFVIMCLCLSAFLSFCVCSFHDCLSVPLV